ncbi:MAG: acetyl-CoA C-acyltransferase [Lysobacterales bacterium]
MSDAYIFDAVRTPRGKGVAARKDKSAGALNGVMPHELVSQLVAALIRRNGEGLSSEIDQLRLGCVGQVDSQGGHVALVSRIAADLPTSVVPKTLNNYCVSGLTSVIESASWTSAGGQGMALAGGVEMVSRVPFQADRAAYYCDPEVAKNLCWLAPAMGAELIATQKGYVKADLDAVTLRSHQRAAAAWEAGAYDSSVIPVRDSEGQVLLQRDESIRGTMNMDDLSRLQPAFVALGQSGQDQIALEHFSALDKVDHVHSVANCPPMADGAALLVTGDLESGKQAGMNPRARIRATAETAGDPILQFGAGFAAMEQVLKRSGLTLGDLHRIEFMEAFAAVPLHFERHYNADLSRTNVYGGHLAMGHPMGASGAILLTTALNALEQSDGELAMVVTLAGGGIGAAVIIERV